MQLEEAIDLLGNNQILPNQPQTWADLGCGNGLFTEALASLLPVGSQIYAMDTELSALDDIPDWFGSVSIKKIQSDFIKKPIPFTKLDGILMANSLHYVKDKPAFIKKTKAVLKPGGSWLVVEYEAQRANPWVPYPESFESLKALFEKEGYALIEKIKTMPSKFGHVIYSVRIS